MTVWPVCSKKKDAQQGFTLVELLIVMVISLVVMGAIYSTFRSQQQSYLHQEQVAVLQQNLRAAMYYMEREIRMAGYDPTGNSGAGISTAGAAVGSTTNTINFSMDYLYGNTTLSDNGVIDDGEDITYSLSGTNIVRNAGTVSVNELIAEYIDSLSFTYLDQDGNGNIETIQVNIVAKTQAGTITSRSLTSNIKCRNIDM